MKIASNPLYAFLVVAATAMLTYFQVYSFAFSYDDFYSVLPIQEVEKLSSIFRYFTEPVLFRSPVSGEMEPLSYFRPIATSTLTIDIFLFGKENPGLLHVENVLLHTINAFLLYLLGRELLKHDVAALFAAMLYVTFPLSAEIVSTYHYRVDHITSLFIFSTLLATLKGSEKSWYWQVAGLFLLAMLCKEAAISLLVLVPLFRHFVVRQLKAFELFAALGIPMLIYWPLRYNALGSFLKVKGAIDFETATHSLTSLDWLLYILESFFRKLTFIFTPFRIPPRVFILEDINYYFVAGGIASIVVLLAIAFYFVRNPNIYSLLVASFFISWFPVSSLLIRIPDFLSPRFFYYPSPWIVLLLTLLLAKIPRKNLVILFSSILLSVWGISSYYQKFMYKNNFAKNLSILEFTPDHRETLWLVANEYLQRNDQKKAQHYFYRFLNASSRAATGIEKEQIFQAHLILADLHIRRNEFSKALMVLNGGSRYFSDRGEIYWFLAMTYWKTGNSEKAENAISEGAKNVVGFEEYQRRFEEFKK